MSKTAKLLILLMGLLLGPTVQAVSEEWHELKGEHFIVYFSAANKDSGSSGTPSDKSTQDRRFAQEVLNKAEVYYRNIAMDLGYPRYSQFWLWDKRVKIYIYLDQDSFIKATGQPRWSQGMAAYKSKKIMSFAWNQVFLDSILPHEIAHLIFRDFVGFEGEIPLWLDEGVAQWAEEIRRSSMKEIAKRRLEENALLTLEDMMKLDIRNIKEKDLLYIRPAVTKDGSKGVLFLSGDNLVSTYYLQAVSVVGFLIERFGSERFAAFCRELRDGKTMEGALKYTYPNYLNNLNELQEAWRQYVISGGK